MLDSEFERSLRLLEDTGFRPPSRIQRTVAWPLYSFFHLLAFLIPARWLIDEPTVTPRTMRGKLAVWAYSGAYFYDERRAGRI
ncbi:MAG: hypothetical protein ABSG79_04220 [Bryobacteraceae bacterium]|jgi:hypothetical protein